MAIWLEILIVCMLGFAIGMLLSIAVWVGKVHGHARYIADTVMKLKVNEEFRRPLS